MKVMQVTIYWLETFCLFLVQFFMLPNYAMRKRSSKVMTSNQLSSLASKEHLILWYQHYSLLDFTFWKYLLICNNQTEWWKMLWMVLFNLETIQYYWSFSLVIRKYLKKETFYLNITLFQLRFLWNIHSKMLDKIRNYQGIIGCSYDCHLHECTLACVGCIIGSGMANF